MDVMPCAKLLAFPSNFKKREKKEKFI